MLAMIFFNSKPVKYREKKKNKERKKGRYNAGKYSMG